MKLETLLGEDHSERSVYLFFSSVFFVIVLSNLENDCSKTKIDKNCF